MSIDKFGETPTFTVNGRDTYSSLIGMVLTLVILGVVIPFGFNKFIIMREYDDTNFQSIVNEQTVGPEEVLTYDQTHANAFIYFTDSKFRPISKETLKGYIVVNHTMFTVDRRSDSPSVEEEILKTSVCTREYLDEHFFNL